MATPCSKCLNALPIRKWYLSWKLELILTSTRAIFVWYSLFLCWNEDENKYTHIIQNPFWTFTSNSFLLSGFCCLFFSPNGITIGSIQFSIGISNTFKGFTFQSNCIHKQMFMKMCKEREKKHEQKFNSSLKCMHNLSANFLEYSMIQSFSPFFLYFFLFLLTCNTDFFCVHLDAVKK